MTINQLIHPSLQTAINIWKRGEPIPCDLAMELAEQGFEVERLEAKYMSDPT